MTAPVYVEGWSALTQFGLDRTSFADAVQSNTPAPPEPVPVDARAALGRGVRLYDRITTLVVVALRDLISGGPEGDSGLVVGTANGGLASLRAFSRDALAIPPVINPARFPATIMNNAAGQAAIRFGLRGPNATVAKGRLSGAAAILYASRLLRQRHAPVMYAGAAEEWPESGEGRGLDFAGADRPGAEASAFVRLSSTRSERTVARVAAIAESRVIGDQPVALATAVRRCLDRAGIEPGAVSLVATAGCGGPNSIEAERLASSQFTAATVVEPARTFGDTGSAAVSVAVAALLAVAEKTAPGYGVCLAANDTSVSALLLAFGTELEIFR
jgi:3-oxoacyl-[acyl-carrier-protein] synthase II